MHAGLGRTDGAQVVRRRTRVLYLIDYFGSLAGTETHLTQLVCRLDRALFEPFLVAFEMKASPLLDEIRGSGATVVHVPVGRYYTLDAVRQARRLRDMIRAWQIDIVETNHFKSDFYGALVAYWAGVPHIVSSKRDVEDIRTPLQLLLNRCVNFVFERVVIVADAVGRAVKRTQRFRPALLRKIYNGVDLGKFRPGAGAERDAVRRELGLAPGDLAAGMVAVFRPEKNHALLLRAAAEALGAVPNLKIVLVGDGPLRARCEEECRQSPLRDRVLFTGTRKDVARILWALDIACLIPRANEGFSNAILEKMAAGLPLVVSAVGGNAEAVTHGMNGFVVGADDRPGVAAALAALGGDADLCARMGRASRAIAEQRFSIAHKIRVYESFYTELMQGAAVSGDPRGMRIRGDESERRGCRAAPCRETGA